jgi:hypothetical protein
MNATPVLEYVGYVAVAVLAALGNRFLGIPDTQTTVLVIGGVLTALGIVKVTAVTSVQQNTSAIQSNTTATQQNTLATIDQATFQSPAASSNTPTRALPATGGDLTRGSVSSKGPL